MSETKEKRPNITHVTEQAIRKTHLKVPRKASRKFHKGVYYASEFLLRRSLFYEYLAAFGIAQASLALLSLARYFLVMAK